MGTGAAGGAPSTRAGSCQSDACMQPVCLLISFAPGCIYMPPYLIERRVTLASECRQVSLVFVRSPDPVSLNSVGALCCRSVVEGGNEAGWVIDCKLVRMIRPAQVCGYHSRVESLGCDMAGQPPSQLIGEEHIRQLGLAIRTPLCVALGLLQVLKIHFACQPVCI